MKTSPLFTSTTLLFPGFPSDFLNTLQSPAPFPDDSLLLVFPMVQISILFTYFSPHFTFKITFTRSSANICKAQCKSTNGDSVSCAYILQNYNIIHLCGSTFPSRSHIPLSRHHHMTSRIKALGQPSCLVPWMVAEVGWSRASQKLGQPRIPGYWLDLPEPKMATGLVMSLRDGQVCLRHIFLFQLRVRSQLFLTSSKTVPSQEVMKEWEQLSGDPGLLRCLIWVIRGSHSF